MRSRAALALTCSLLFVGAGCSSYTPPEQLPTFQIDADASEVIAIGPHGSDKVAQKMRSQIAWALSDMMADRDSTDAKPARFRAQVTYDLDTWQLAACLFVLALFGCPSANTSVDLDLTLEVDGMTYRGHSSYSALSGIYYNGDGAGTIEAATQMALDMALQDAGLSPTSGDTP
jgi:hypothetical protein